jgi:hypothetical protein
MRSTVLPIERGGAVAGPGCPTEATRDRDVSVTWPVQRFLTNGLKKSNVRSTSFDRSLDPVAHLGRDISTRHVQVGFGSHHELTGGEAHEGDLLQEASAARAVEQVRPQDDPFQAIEVAVEGFRREVCHFPAGEIEQPPERYQSTHERDRPFMSLGGRGTSTEPVDFERFPQERACPMKPRPEIGGGDPEDLLDFLRAKSFDLAEVKRVGKP